MSDPNDVQHGGDHYRSPFQHWDCVALLGLNYYAACATKYITRHWKKNREEDVRKARHFIEKLIQLDERCAIGFGTVSYTTPFPYRISVSDDFRYLTLMQQQLVENFIDSNKLAGSEAEFMRTVMMASSKEDLSRAGAILSWIEADYSAGGYGDAGRGYVDQG